MYTVTIVTNHDSIQYGTDNIRQAIRTLYSWRVIRLYIRQGNQLILNVAKKPFDI
jgi:hypothetical protein